MRVEEAKLKEFLLDTSIVSRGEYEDALEAAKERKMTVSDYLVSEGRVSEEDMRKAHAYVTGISYIDIVKEKIPLEILSLIPEPVARTHNIVAYAKSEQGLEVAMLDTADITAIDFIKKKTGLRILPRLASVESIKSALVQYQKNLKAEFGDLIQTDANALKTFPEKGDDVSQEEMKKMAENLPVVRIVDTLLKHAAIQNASDIHIEPAELQVIIRYRIDGILHDAMVLPKHVAPSIVARVKVLSNLKLDEKRVPQDGRFKIELDNERISFRVSTIPVYFGEKVVMRLLRENVAGFSLEKLGFHGSAFERVHAAMTQTTGIILTTGPTGSGKSTTLYTLLDQLNTPDVNISTIEDPIEYQMKRINQTQVKPEIGFTFANGLRSLMRQDPDVIMVGEIRDGETAGLAINAAITGHVVLSTLHTNSASSAVPRLVDMGAEPFLMVSTIRLVIGQRLLRRLTDEKEEYVLSEAELKALEKKIDLDHVLAALKEEGVVKESATWKDISFCKPKATPEGDGYKGQIGIYEVMPITSSLKELIITGAPSEKIEEQAKKEGMLTMLEDGIFKAVQGVTTIDEVLRVVNK